MQGFAKTSTVANDAGAMSRKIAKIGKLINPESFLQLDLVKGYKYIDRAGEIVNMYSDPAPPVFQIAMNQLVINEPTDRIEQLKVSPNVVWAKFTEPDSIDQAHQVFEREAAKLLKVMEIEKVARVGWRNYFVVEFEKPEEAAAYLRKMVTVTLNGCSLSTVKLDLKTKDGILGNIFLQEVIKEHAEDDKKKVHAIMFDVDLYTKDIVEVASIGQIFKGFRDYLSSTDGLLALVNEHLV